MLDQKDAQQPAAGEVGWTAYATRLISPNEVAALLEREGLRLNISMPACKKRWGWLPAQYHYSSKDGTEVIWLAGPDPEARGQDPTAPVHHSRFWLYISRRDPTNRRAEQIRARLSDTFQLDWQPLAASLANPLRPTS